MANSAYDQLQLVHQLRPFLDKKDLVTVTHALTSFQLDYRKMLYMDFFQSLWLEN